MAVIPFSILPPKLLLRLSPHFIKWADSLKKLFPFLELELLRADFKVKPKQYLAMCLVASTFLFVFLTLFLTLIFSKQGDYFLGLIISLPFCVIIFLLQASYPKVSANRRIRMIDADLLASLRAMLIHIDSGIPLFEAMVIVSTQKFGEVSKEFAETVHKINAGVSQIDALEEMALRNPSPYFRRTIWQIINGMKEGSAINQVMENVISNLTKEQIIQIEKYGSQLSPLAMFYMMGAIILPALGITFLVVLTSFIELNPSLVKLMFMGLFVFVIFFQLMFSGAIKTKRPSLLG
jgi:pilus assembly protein TadC